MNKRLVVFPGQRVICTDGKTHTVAYQSHGQVFVFGANGMPVPAKPVTDAWGGEHDMELGLAA